MRLLLFFTLSFASCLAQIGSVVPETPGSNLPAHQIGPNDLLAISVYDAPELSKSIRVSQDGKIRFPMLQARIKAQGYLPAELEETIAEALKKEKILVNPMVTVNVAEYHSRPINIVGAVKNPLTFQAVGPTTLLDALARAGGLAETAGPEVLVSHAATEKSEAGVQHISVRDLIDGAGSAMNIPLYGGEEIRVPASGRVFVLGNVKRPGAFPLHEAGEGTVLQMLALAEGLAPFPAKLAYIYRRGANGARTEMSIELEAILKRKKSDVSVLPDDILYIPDNKGKRLTATAIDRVLTFGSTAGATALIYSGR